jgi:small-conductance mechanosensitive channel
MAHFFNSEGKSRSRRMMKCYGCTIALALGLCILGFIAPTLGQSAPVALGSSDVIAFLSKTIDWYRQTASNEQQIATDPVDLAFADNNRRTADEVARLTFEFARQQEQVLSAQAKPNQAQTANTNLSQYQSLVQGAANADQQVQQIQSELSQLEQKKDTATAKQRKDLDSQIAELNSELALTQARRDVLHNMIEFVGQANMSGLGTVGLRAEIDQLARSVPAYVSEPPNKNANTQSSSASPAQSPSKTATPKSAPNGIWGYAADLFHLSRKETTLKGEIASTDELAQAASQLRVPLVASLKTMIQNGDQLEHQADTSDPATLAQQKQKLDQLTAEYRQISAALVPLSKQAILLDIYKRSLTAWLGTIKSDYLEDLKNLLVRLGGLVVVIGVVFGIGEVWRRTIDRYVQDSRRRYQFLLLRRIVLWVAVAIILVFTFATELSSIVTFAGLITAGVAVALQNVIVSIVGYFFLIGKYGIRVGDRVQVAGVNGEVVDIGMVRFHLMELAGGTMDSEPSGRVVAFSNSIVFQSTAGLFKQIPGTSFVWHEIKLTFAPETDYHAVRERVDHAVDAAFSAYQDSLERQRVQMERSLTYVSGSALKPRATLQFATSGIEVLIRYPVVLQNSAEIDEHLMHDLLAEVNREPKLKLLGTEVPADEAVA